VSTARQLAPGGIYVFDVNTTLTYRETFGRAMVVEHDALVCCWRPVPAHGGPPGRHVSDVDVFAQGADGRWDRSTSRHVQRHHPPERVRAALQAAGLTCVAVLGQRPGGLLEPGADDERHPKLLYVARRDPATDRAERRWTMQIVTP
jgi:hypothetical protein